jgi:N-methylhydantoinase A
VERGEDPRDFPLVAFGGGGGLHACELAAELGVATVIVPRLAGALSALGMLLADRTRDYSIGALGASDREARYRKLEKQAKRDVRGAQLSRYADIRYAGQSYELTVPHGGDFHKEHQRVYGYSDPQRATETVTLRLRAVVKVEKPSLQIPRRPPGTPGKRNVWIAGRWRHIPVASRDDFPSKPLRGPLLIADYGSTTLVPAGWSMTRDNAGSVILDRRPQYSSSADRSPQPARK